MTGFEVVILPLILKYLTNALSAFERWSATNIPNAAKQLTVIVLAYLATQIPQLKPYLPQADPVLTAAFVSILTWIAHHVIELLVAVEKKANGLAPTAPH